MQTSLPLFALWAAWLLLTGCAPGGGRIEVDDLDDSMFECVGPNDPLPAFEDYLTWRNWDGGSTQWPEQAIYVWSGEVIGKGGDGFVAMLERINQMYPGQRVLVYPNYYYKIGVSGDWKMLPFQKELDIVKYRLRKNGVIMVFSWKDYKGKFVPIPGSRPAGCNKKRKRTG